MRLQSRTVKFLRPCISFRKTRQVVNYTSCEFFIIIGTGILAQAFIINYREKFKHTISAAGPLNSQGAHGRIFKGPNALARNLCKDALICEPQSLFGA